jgi:predicted nucleic acid-binding protein
VIVLDSSAAVEYLVGSNLGAWVEQRLLADPELHAPHLLDVEVAAALRRQIQLGGVALPLAEQALADLADLHMTRYPHLPFLARAWQLRANVTVADGVFVALAEALDATLVTTDSGLAGAPGVFARIEAPV